MRNKGLLGSIFAVSLVFASMALTVSAQRNGGRNFDGYPNWGGSYDLRQTALNAGYNDGTKEGQKDMSRGRTSNYGDFSSYRDGTKDYSSRLGDRSLYQRYYRIAFEHGYADGNPNSGYGSTRGYNSGTGYDTTGGNNRGYNDDRDRNRNNNDDWRNRQSRGRNWGQYGNYGGNSNFRQTALNAGYNEGIKHGRSDRNRGPRNLNDISQYRDAKQDYNSRDGNFALYQRYYREGFENGYYDGLRGY